MQLHFPYINAQDNPKKKKKKRKRYAQREVNLIRETVYI